MLTKERDRLAELAKELYSLIRGPKDGNDPLDAEVDEVEADLVEVAVYADIGTSTYEWESDHTRPTDWEPRTKSHSVDFDVGIGLMASIGDSVAVYYFGYLANDADNASYMADCKDSFSNSAWFTDRFDGESPVESLERIVKSPDLVESLKKAISRRKDVQASDLDDRGLLPDRYLRESAPAETATLQNVYDLAKKVCDLAGYLTGCELTDFLDDPSLLHDLGYAYLDSDQATEKDKALIMADFLSFVDALRDDLKKRT